MRRRAIAWGAAGLVIALAIAFFLLNGRDEPVDAAHDRWREIGESGGEDPVTPAEQNRAEEAALVFADGGVATMPGEEIVRMPSAVRIAIEADRDWVCAGEPIGLAARVGGEPRDAVHRWLWAGSGGAELHPGPALAWRAPESAGKHTIVFQVCRDLGGRRVGVLAERVVEIDVRRCGEGEGQEDERLRITVSQRRHGSYAFAAIVRGDPRIRSYRWDYGDGRQETTTAPGVEHAYDVSELGTYDTRSFVVRLEAVPAGGEPLVASAIVQVRGSAPGGEAHPVTADVARFEPHAGGHRAAITLRTAGERAITWETVERITQYFDGRVEIRILPWNDAISVDESLPGGGLRGHAHVGASETPDGVKQIIDVLHGRDTSGEDVSISWSPFKREPQASTEMPAEPRPGD